MYRKKITRKPDPNVERMLMVILQQQPIHPDERQQMIIAAQRLQDEIGQAIKDHKINGPANPAFTYQWNQDHKYLEIHCANPEFLGVVTFSGSNNDPMLADFLARADKIKQTALDTLGKPLQNIKLLHLLGIIRHKITTQYKIFSDQSLGLSTREQALDDIKDHLRELVIYSAIAIMDPKPDEPISVGDVKNTIHKMLNTLVESASNTPRKILCWANRVNNFVDKQKKAEYILRCFFPISNTSCYLPQLVDLKFANLYDTKEIALIMQRDALADPYTSNELIINGSRSAGLRGEEQDKAPTMQATITKRARELLVQELSALAPTSEPHKELSVYFLYNTLVSPFIPHAPSAANLFEAAIGKSMLSKHLGSENEKVIFDDTNKYVTALNGKVLSFSEEDKQFIRKSLPNRRLNLNDIKIRPVAVHLNFPMNKLGELTSSANFREKNKEAMDNLAKIIEVLRKDRSLSYRYSELLHHFHRIQRLLENNEFHNWTANYAVAYAHAGILWDIIDGYQRASCRHGKDRTELSQIIRYCIFINNAELVPEGTVISRGKDVAEGVPIPLDMEGVINGIIQGPGPFLSARNFGDCEFSAIDLMPSVLDGVPGSENLKRILTQKMCSQIAKLTEKVFNPSDKMIKQCLTNRAIVVETSDEARVSAPSSSASASAATIIPRYKTKPKPQQIQPSPKSFKEQIKQAAANLKKSKKNPPKR